MREYEGYIENGQFFPIGNPIQVAEPGRRRAFLTVLDEPANIIDKAQRLAVLDQFFAEIKCSDEPVPDFERVHFRESEL